jgi:hypothetical protein
MYYSRHTYTRLDDAQSNFTHIQWIIVTPTVISIGMDERGVFPCLREASIVEKDITFFELIS